MIETVGPLVIHQQLEITFSKKVIQHFLKIRSKLLRISILGSKQTGFHISWSGVNGDQIFNQMPLWNDDDDYDPSYSPPVGCRTCIDGQLNPAECDVSKIN